MNEENYGKNSRSPRRMLAELGLAAHKGRGQNFLVDPNTARAIVSRAALAKDIPVLEIGPGLGALTRPLLEAGHRVLAVEIDLGLAAYLEKELVPRYPDRLTLITGDILQVNLVEAVGGKFSVAGNLPYQISTPLLIKLLDNRQAIAGAALMFQRELAERLAAGPGSREYGRLSVLLGYYCRIERLMDLGPQAFHPRPKVGSTVLSLQFKQSPRPDLKDPQMFKKIVAAGFSRRRKTLANALKSAFTPEEIREGLSGTGLDPTRRAETLTIEEFAALSNRWPEKDKEHP